MVRLVTYDTRQEWLENRKNGIGGSEISAVIGINPYKSNVELWEEKTGRRIPPDISDKPYVKYGNDAEPLLRQLFELDHPEYEMFYQENNSFFNPNYPWAQASLDGWLKDENGRYGVWECKTTEIMNNSQWDSWDGCIPNNYYCQVLFYMAILNADFAILNAQIKYHGKDGALSKSTRIYEIERTDVQEDIDMLMNAGKTFWEAVTEDKRPNMIINI